MRVGGGGALLVEVVEECMGKDDELACDVELRESEGKADTFCDMEAGVLYVGEMRGKVKEHH